MINPIFENCISENDCIVAEANLELQPPEPATHCAWCGKKLEVHFANEAYIKRDCCSAKCLSAYILYNNRPTWNESEKCWE